MKRHNDSSSCTCKAISLLLEYLRPWRCFVNVVFFCAAIGRESPHRHALEPAGLIRVIVCGEFVPTYGTSTVSAQPCLNAGTVVEVPTRHERHLVSHCMAFATNVAGTVVLVFQILTGKSHLRQLPERRFRRRRRTTSSSSGGIHRFHVYLGLSKKTLEKVFHGGEALLQCLDFVASVAFFVEGIRTMGRCSSSYSPE